jgi:hypothetical protein
VARAALAVWPLAFFAPAFAVLLARRAVFFGAVRPALCA